MGALKINEDHSRTLVGQLLQWATDHPGSSCHCYVLIDAAQDKTAWQRLLQQSLASCPLFSATEDQIPHLLDFGSIDQLSEEQKKMLAQKHALSAFTVLCSRLSISELHAHLSRFLDVKLPGDCEMLLAFWDPAILGTLVGQADDASLHVAGPVLSPEQLAVFLFPIVIWWYFDREGVLHCIERSSEGLYEFGSVLPLKLTQAQEDQLVEAGVPDQVLYHLELNRPTLFDQDLPHAKRYRFVRAVLPSARQLGLDGMRDLVSFVALCLIYRQRIETDSEIVNLLDQVQRKSLSFEDALKEMPE